MVRETLRQQQEEMAHSCLEGGEENKETEPPEAAELQGGHRPWAHTHLQAGSAARVSAQHLPSCQPCWQPGTPLHIWLQHLWISLWMLLGAELGVTHQHSRGRWKWTFDEFPRSTAKRDAANTTAGRAPSTAPAHCGLHRRDFSVFG